MSSIKNLEYKIANNKKAIEKIKIKILDDNKTQMHIIHKALKQQLKNGRIRNANTKTRSEIRGGGKKPWKQKGTGRARAGSNRSPLWRGGGVIFGPKKKIYKSKINKKEKRLAINTLIANKFGQTIIINTLLANITKPSTQQAIKEIQQIGIKIDKRKKILIAIEQQNHNIYLSFRNLKNIEIIEVNSFNILSLLKADTILITHAAIRKLNYFI
uniref:Large ribosomal subunit protein uL4c n=1 Tax=Polysiphonia infestans TaxID=2006978 RepID=A0A1Z1MEE1_9FLOR|nr:ribosomal protein L4 [Polysiphonia infestans]ARW64400.1 ribosomal protein L4 [Polysiphonia infestans]